ncbi:TetR/AcrR family transcriptional regulator [Convivina praedatoris]|uniref:HTH tetR-type domain-containing protein n=1 Tax=Convivina praedatoris TaxID=2880963 RepID=A0ABN8HF01_9LACO|nr:TetR/AcrR family transcriptional regulator [Convivina sp. LMG 32447]CAH1851916.1 hypothetical protein LMG032447_00439 [Convivina sp. LMG 32447]CAH1851950.1 hypothetical protein R078138_00449 [Convivina sp. LMG 32447]CAH1852956.1 hypothetical protein R077815_00668 [Convivina sp. LMG 32447]
MPKETFLNLSAAKQNRIEASLATEFSGYCLLDVSVERIVKGANISRGSFYTYFEDVDDAYLWILKQIVADIHQNVGPEDSLENLLKFIQDVENNPSYNFLRNYYLINRAILELHRYEKEFNGTGIPSLEFEQSLLPWMTNLAGHELIRQYFWHPADKNQIIERIQAIEQWHKGANK